MHSPKVNTTDTADTANKAEQSGAPSAAVIAQAAEWMVRLSADDMTSAEHAALQAEFEQWQQAHPNHAKAARAMTGLLQQTRQASATAHPAAAHAAIEASTTQNSKQLPIKKLAKALLLVLSLALPAWIFLQHNPPAYLLADARTSTGQWETHTLVDNSLITLGNKSAANFYFDSQQRKLELVHGEMLVDVAVDADADRPFLVQTRHGQIRALGTRFIVTLNDQVTTLTMLESRAAISISTAMPAAATDDQTGFAGPERNAENVLVNAGQRVRFSHQWISDIETIDANDIANAWQSRHWIVENRSLPEVLDTLSRYHPGLIRYDREQLETMKVTAALPLDDVDRALYLLTRSFPIRVHTLTPWLTIIEPQRSNHAPTVPDRRSVQK